MPVERMGQYIGAKVTPSFFENPLDGTNDWVQGITYEELTVVTYDSKLYISKKPVRDITVTPENTEYWLEYPSGGGGGESAISLNMTFSPYLYENPRFSAYLTEQNDVQVSIACKTRAEIPYAYHLGDILIPDTYQLINVEQYFLSSTSVKITANNFSTQYITYENYQSNIRIRNMGTAILAESYLYIQSNLNKVVTAL